MNADFHPRQPDPAADGPAELDTLPDGRQSLTLGHVRAYAAFNHRQGDNPEHFQLDCGLVSVQDVLRQFGAHVNEGDVVAHALQRGECFVAPAEADQSGGTEPSEDARVLTDYGLPSRVESGRTLSQLAAMVSGTVASITP
jgi:hypothetical protein